MKGIMEIMMTGEKAQNGVMLLLKEIQKHQPDMPAEVRDDMNFGAIVVLYEMGRARAGRLKILEKFSLLYGGLLLLIFTTIVALHSNVPWLTNLLETIFGT